MRPMVVMAIFGVIVTAGVVSATATRFWWAYVMSAAWRLRLYIVGSFLFKRVSLQCPLSRGITVESGLGQDVDTQQDVADRHSSGVVDDGITPLTKGQGLQAIQ